MSPVATTLPGLLAYRAETVPDEVVIVCDDESLSYAELDRGSRNLAQHLLSAGIGKNDRIGVMMPNGIGWALVAFGVLRAGATLVPLSTLLRPPELLAHLDSGSVTGLVTVPTYRGRHYLDDLDEAVPGARAALARSEILTPLPFLRRMWVWGEDLRVTDPPSRELPEPRVRAGDDATILFTSGSRGMPKATIHTHGSVLRAVATSLDGRCVRRGDRLYIPMPFFWAGGYAGGLLTSLVAGATLLTEVSPEPERTLAFLKRERVTLFRGWPMQGARLAAHPGFDVGDLPDLRAGSIEALLPAHLHSRPGARANLFGMTETLGPWAGFPLDTDMPADKFGSCGKPFAGVEVKIVDVETGQDQPPGVDGQVLLRGDTIMRGICGRERHDVFDADGYYPTGDIGRVDADGFFWYEGRLDDMFKVSGATVYPGEVEKALLGAPGISHAFVTDVRVGERVEVGAVVVAPGLDVAELTKQARAVLSSFKVPTVWVLLGGEAEVPRLASDKPDKKELQRMLRDTGVRPVSA